MDTPLRFVPFLRPMVWGGRRLEEVLKKKLPGQERYGESWEISDHAVHRSVVATNPLAGRSLRSLMEADATSLLGTAAALYETFPWLIKFLDADDWLSVQVHPDEQAVRHLWPGECSKTEAWFVVDAAAGSRIYAGLLPGTDERRLRELLKSGHVADCLHRFEPRAGDCLFLPAGTVHAVGGGVLMAEVQQTSDATFRLFDWNRRDSHGKSRPLHVEEAVASIDWRRGPIEPVRVGHFTEGAGASESWQSLVHCPYFALEYVHSRQPLVYGGAGVLQVLIVLKGRGAWETGSAPEEMSAGEAWLLPAAMRRMTCSPHQTLSALLCTLP